MHGQTADQLYKHRPSAAWQTICNGSCCACRCQRLSRSTASFRVPVEPTLSHRDLSSAQPRQPASHQRGFPRPSLALLYLLTHQPAPKIWSPNRIWNGRPQRQSSQRLIAATTRRSTPRRFTNRPLRSTSGLTSHPHHRGRRSPSCEPSLALRLELTLSPRRHASAPGRYECTASLVQRRLGRLCALGNSLQISYSRPPACVPSHAHRIRCPASSRRAH